MEVAGAENLLIRLVELQSAGRILMTAKLFLEILDIRIRMWYYILVARKQERERRNKWLRERNEKRAG